MVKSIAIVRGVSLNFFVVDNSGVPDKIGVDVPLFDSDLVGESSVERIGRLIADKGVLVEFGEISNCSLELANSLGRLFADKGELVTIDDKGLLAFGEVGKCMVVVGITFDTSNSIGESSVELDVGGQVFDMHGRCVLVFVQLRFSIRLSRAVITVGFDPCK